MRHFLVVLIALCVCSSCVASSKPVAEPSAKPANKRSTSEIIEQSKPSEWRQLQPSNTMYMQFENGEVVFELSPTFTPEHYANLRVLVANKYFDNLSIIRVHDNYVVQWGDINYDNDKAKSIGKAKEKLDMEFFVPIEEASFTRLDSKDAYAKMVGHVEGFPVASDGKKVWLTHCYGMLGVGRGNEANSGNATGLYVVIGHSPRNLDKNVTLVGRVVSGIEHLSSLPRGSGGLGFYDDPKDHINITSVRFGDDIPESERTTLEVMRTDSQSFKDYVYSRTHRSSDWYIDKVGSVELCNVGVPMRDASK